MTTVQFLHRITGNFLAMTQKEKNNKVIAAASTVGMYALLFLVMLFTVAWRAPYPPIPGGSGVSLILGTDDYGSGDVPLTEPAGAQEPEKPKEETPTQEEPKEEEKQQVQEDPEDKDVVTSTEESPVTVKKEEPKKKEEKKEPIKPVEPVKKEETTKKEETPKAVYNPNKTTGSTDTKTGTPGSKGDDEGKTGDKGDPRGTPTGAVYKGNPGTGGDGKGGSGGPLLDMAGWEWVEIPATPKPSEEDQFSGKVVFVFDVDETGEIVNIKKESGNLSFELEKKCKAALEKTSLYKTSSGVAPPKTTGRVTFTLKVQ
jgi:periplasmic protein TonB